MYSIVLHEYTDILSCLVCLKPVGAVKSAVKVADPYTSTCTCRVLFCTDIHCTVMHTCTFRLHLSLELYHVTTDVGVLRLVI